MTQALQVKATFTPGEWECEGDQFAVHINAVSTHQGRPSYTRIAVVDRTMAAENEDGMDLNACLISAAPDMLAAIKAYEKAIGAGINADPKLWADAALKGQAAIAKAEGR